MPTLKAPKPTITPYISPAKGGNYNVPKGQTAYSYPQKFIGPVPYASGKVGAPVSSSKISNVLGASSTSGPISGGGGMAPQPAPAPTPQQSYDFGGSYNNDSADLDRQINDSYAPAYDNLNLMESQYKQEFPTAQAALSADNTQAQNDIQAEQNTRLTGIQDQRVAGQKSKQSQIAKARQMYNELRQGNLVRFGGSSSTADASSEILGRGAQEQFGGIEQNFGDLEQGLVKEEANINSFYSNKRTELGERTRVAEKQLKDQFDAKIREINRGRNELDSAKAGKRLAALQELSASYRQIKAESAQFAQELDAWKQFKDEALTNARSFGARQFTIPGFKNTFGNYTITRPAGGGGGGYDAYDPSNVQGVIDNVPDGYELSQIGINAGNKPSYTIKKQDNTEDLINQIAGY